MAVRRIPSPKHDQPGATTVNLHQVNVTLEKARSKRYDLLIHHGFADAENPLRDLYLRTASTEPSSFMKLASS